MADIGKTRKSPSNESRAHRFQSRTHGFQSRAHRFQSRATSNNGWSRAEQRRAGLREGPQSGNRGGGPPRFPFFALPGIPRGVLGTPRGVLGTPRALPETPKVMPGTPRALPGTPKVMPGTPKALPGTPKVMPGTPEALPGTPRAARDSRSVTRAALPFRVRRGNQEPWNSPARA